MPTPAPLRPGSASAAAGKARYRKTPLGRDALAAPRGHLPLRDRQLLLLCNGQRDLAELTALFGDSTARELSRLSDAGWLTLAGADAASPAAPAFSPTMPPVDRALAQSANQSGFGATQPPLADALAAASAQAGVMLAEVGGPAAEQWMRQGVGAQTEADVLAFVNRAMTLAGQAWGDEALRPWAEQIARLLPRSSVGRLIDRLVDDGRTSLLVASLYERVLADSDSDTHSDPGGDAR